MLIIAEIYQTVNSASIISIIAEIYHDSLESVGREPKHNAACVHGQICGAIALPNIVLQPNSIGNVIHNDRSSVAK